MRIFDSDGYPFTVAEAIDDLREAEEYPELCETVLRANSGMNLQDLMGFISSMAFDQLEILELSEDSENLPARDISLTHCLICKKGIYSGQERRDTSIILENDRSPRSHLFTVALNLELISKTLEMLSDFFSSSRMRSLLESSRSIKDRCLHAREKYWSKYIPEEILNYFPPK